jgi:hypothetical protein
MSSIPEHWAWVENPSPLLFWVGSSLLVYALAANVLWWRRSSWSTPYRQRLVEVGRFFFYLGIPYLALGGWPQRPYKGLLSLEDMGLVGLGGQWPAARWLGAVGVGLGWGLAALLILALAWASANRRAGGIQLGFPSRPWWWILIDVIYLQAHWAFYRSALAVALNDAFVGCFLGLGLIYLEWSLNPFWRHGWRLEAQAAAPWLRAALALVIAVLFFLSRNLWICLGAHWRLEFCLRRLDYSHRRQKAHTSPAVVG